MKPKDYVRKHKFDQPSQHIDVKELFEDFQTDFLVLLEVGKARESIEGYENAIRAMGNKYHAILNRAHETNRAIIDKVWKKFYAVIVASTREQLFPEEMKERRAEKKWREQYRRKRGYDDFMNAFGGGDLWDELLKGFRKFWDNVFFGAEDLVKGDPFREMGLESNATAEEVKVRYWELAKQHHPDKGGDRHEFERITAAKNRCLRRLGVA